MTSRQRRLKGSYWSYSLTYFFYFLAMSLFSSVLSVYLTGIGKSATEMSFIVSASGIFSFLMVPVTGYLNDRTQNPRLISGILLVLAGLAGMIFSFSRNTLLLFLLNGLIQSSINSLMPICERMASACPYRYGTIRIGGTLGYAVGAQCAGFAVEHFPSQVLFASLLAAIALTIFFFQFTEDTPIPPEAVREDNASGPRKPRLLSLLKNRQFFLYVVVACLFSACSGTNMTYAPVLLESLGVPITAVGTVLFFSTLVEIPLILFSNRFMDRLSGKFLMALAFSLILLQFLFYGLVPSAAVVVAVMIAVKAIASTLFVMVTLKIVRNLLSPRVTTTGLSIVNSMNSVGTILAQNASGRIVDGSTIQTLYLCLACVAVGGLLLTLFLKVQNRENVFS